MHFKIKEVPLDDFENKVYDLVFKSVKSEILYGCKVFNSGYLKDEYIRLIVLLFAMI